MLFLNKIKNLTQFSEGRIIVLNEVNSTNQYIMDNIRYMKSGNAVVAEYQTCGRGRYGNIWIAPFGQNICLSMYWRFNQKILPTIIELSLMVSIVVAKILQDLGVSHVKIKWPNDLYVNKKKLAGILIEIITRKNYVICVVIGIGINVSMRMNKQLKNEISNKYICLKDIGIIIDRNILVAKLINVLREKLKDFENYGFTPFLSHWRDFDYLYKKQIILFIRNHSVIKNGVAMGIDEHGALMVETLRVLRNYSKNNISVNLL